MKHEHKEAWLEARENGWNNDDHFDMVFSDHIGEYKELRGEEPPEYSYKNK